TIMGARTFGKGSVQKVIGLPGGSGVKLTVSRYMTPLGRSIQALGIMPDLLVDETAAGAGNDAPRLRETDLARHLGNVAAAPGAAA
ncbi:S41 family peptidase, partial [Massilia glaciei]